MVALFGCLYAGWIAVPVPSQAQLNLLGIVRDARPAVAMTNQAMLTRLQPRLAAEPELNALAWLLTDTLPNDVTESSCEPGHAPDDAGDFAVHLRLDGRAARRRC